MKRIHKVAVLGAGTMGARIAAHFANAGVPSYLLDIVPPDADGPARNKIAAAGLEAARKSKPAAFFEPSLVAAGHHRQLRRRPENAGRSRLDHRGRGRESRDQARVAQEGRSRPQAGNHHHDQHQRPAGGQDCRGLSGGFPPLLVRHALLQSAALHAAAGDYSHARDRPRRCIEAVAHFSDVRLGKGVVFAKDTPNFIANRIGTFSVLNVMRLMQEMDLTIEDVDALTGHARGLAEVRDLPHDRPGRPRHSGARGQQHDQERAR